MTEPETRGRRLRALVLGALLLATQFPTAIADAATRDRFPANGAGWTSLYYVDFGRTSDPRDPAQCLARPADAWPDYCTSWEGYGLRVVERFAEAGKPFAMRGADSTSQRPGRDLRTSVVGREGTYSLGIHDGTYLLILKMGDLEEERGPFDVYAGDSLLVPGVHTEPGRFQTFSGDVTATGGRIRLRFVARPGHVFAVNELTLMGPALTPGVLLFQRQRETRVPKLVELSRGDTLGAPDAPLRSVADWLLAQMDDTGQMSAHRLWYQNAYAVKALLASSEVLGDDRYRIAAERTLDAFVGEQLPTGAWAPYSRGVPTSGLRPAAVESLLARTANVADASAIVSCLPVAAMRANPARAGRYLDAAKKFEEEFALRLQLPSGAFSNGRWEWKDYEAPYSVSTGCQCTVLAPLALATGSARYREASDRAAWFLVKNWETDGRPRHFFEDPKKARMDSFIVPATNFGDIFYCLEGLVWAERATADTALAAAIRSTLRNYAVGKKGALRYLGENAWWDFHDPWSDSKSAAIPWVLAETIEQGVEDPEIRSALSALETFLLDAHARRRIGVTENPWTPNGYHATAATGFAGLSLAAFLDPEAFFPFPRGGR